MKQRNALNVLFGLALLGFATHSLAGPCSDDSQDNKALKIKVESLKILEQKVDAAKFKGSLHQLRCNPDLFDFENTKGKLLFEINDLFLHHLKHSEERVAALAWSILMDGETTERAPCGKVVYGNTETSVIHHRDSDEFTRSITGSSTKNTCTGINSAGGSSFWLKVKMHADGKGGTLEFSHGEE